MQNSEASSLVDPTEFRTIRDRLASLEQKPDFGGADVSEAVTAKLQKLVGEAMASPARSEAGENNCTATPGRSSGWNPANTPTTAQFLVGSPLAPSSGSPIGFSPAPSTIASAYNYNPYSAKPPVTSEEWHRQEDPSSARISAKVLFSDTHILPVLQRIVDDSGVAAGDVKFGIKRLYRSAVIRALGPGHQQKHIVQQILANQRETEGKSFKRHTVKDVD